MGSIPISKFDLFSKLKICNSHFLKDPSFILKPILKFLACLREKNGTLFQILKKKSRLQIYQILTNDDQMLILCLSYFITAVSKIVSVQDLNYRLENQTQFQL